MHEEFVKAWEARWPIELLATPYELKRRFPDQWVRFHCLPESKRYAESESEYAIVLDRYNTILGELYSETEIYIVNAEYDSEPVPSGPKQKWWTVMRDEDPEFGPTYAHLSLRRDLWQRGMIDTSCAGSPTTRIPAASSPTRERAGCSTRTTEAWTSLPRPPATGTGCETATETGCRSTRSVFESRMQQGLGGAGPAFSPGHVAAV